MSEADYSPRTIRILGIRVLDGSPLGVLRTERQIPWEPSDVRMSFNRKMTKDEAYDNMVSFETDLGSLKLRHGRELLRMYFSLSSKTKFII